MSYVEIPKTVRDSLQVPEWKEGILEEMRALEKNKTWEVMNLPREKKTVGCKWVFTTKYKTDGSLERYKARLVAKGYKQKLLQRSICSGCKAWHNQIGDRIGSSKLMAYLPVGREISIPPW